MLRKKGVVGKFVEFFGEGCDSLTLADRATISNMAPEYGATVGYFPIDSKTIDYLKLTGREEDRIAAIEAYARAQDLFRLYDGSQEEPVYSDLLELDLGTVESCLAGPKRPHDKVDMKVMKEDFETALTAKVGFKGYGLQEEELKK